MKIEVCASTIKEVQAAAEASADRVELCSALELGGLTPSLGFIARAVKTKIGVHVLIRPREGDFYYSAEEINTMKSDIISAADAGAEGVVFGVLDSDGNFDKLANAGLLALAKNHGLETTFHRAFDLVNDPIRTLEHLIELRFDRLLTSGQQPAAQEGIHLIRALKFHANGRLQIMAGSGVSVQNAKDLAEAGIDALHFSARRKTDELPLGLGPNWESDHDKIRRIIQLVRR